MGPSLAIARRSILRTVRRPQLLMPMFLVPVMFLAVTSGGAARSTTLKGFPHVENFFHFALAGSIMQSTMLGGLMVGIALAMDIESGFFDRMVTTPAGRSHLIMGRILGGSVIAILQALLFLVIGFVFGAHVQGGIAGALLVCLLAVLTAASAASLAMALALKTRAASVVQGMFPFVFVGIFLSSTFFPRQMMVGPAKALADINPLSFIAEGIRNPIIANINGHTELLALANGFGAFLLLCGLCLWMLRARIGEA